VTFLLRIISDLAFWDGKIAILEGMADFNVS